MFQEITDSLSRLPDEEIFPHLPQDLTLTEAPKELPPDVFIKRPKIGLYDVFSKHKVVHLFPEGLMEEAEVMEVLGSQPYPNIVEYHDCHVQRGHITGLVFKRHPHGLTGYLKRGHIIKDEALFMHQWSRQSITHTRLAGRITMSTPHTSSWQKTEDLF